MLRIVLARTRARARGENPQQLKKKSASKEKITARRARWSCKLRMLISVVVGTKSA
jgi:hypothetical protein